MASAGGGAAGEGEWLKVAELRAMVEAQEPQAKEVDNLTLRRFLRARDHNVDKASAMFLKFLRWRKEVAPNGYVPEELVRRELSQDKACMGGFDRTGRPVLVAFPARHYSANRDMAEFKSKHVVHLHDPVASRSSCADFVIYFFDKICARIPRGQEKFLCIVDFKGWGYSNCDVRAYIAAIEIMQNYYPERLGKALMINVPYMFMKAWKMVYPFIDNNTRDKFVFIDDKSLQETLQREMDDSQIPEFLGGKMPLTPLKDHVQQPQSV
ncbi:hypothetical protein EJB05_16444 [Eragrostis curvula]|uniref:CRAL-TRIO domain-containing protein n=1 Tax=Eragrostis curvula TaxID=38414 RepID=A0A5J9VGL8_9POAL|nr:hypothetical protein EJB05_16444 [Eragrostis curvula]